MSGARRLVLPFLVACLAFAVGIALGTGPLQGTRRTTDTAALRSANSQLRDRVDQLRRGRLFDASLAKSTRPASVRGTLAGRPVALFVLPGVDRAQTSQLASTVKESGGMLTVTARLQPALVDPARKTYVDSVAASSLHGLTDLTGLQGSDTYHQIAALIARAYVGQGNDTVVDGEASSIGAELVGAKLVTLQHPALRRGSLVIVLAPGGHGPGSAQAARTLIETALVTSLASASDGLVVVAPATASQPGGLFEALTGGPERPKLSTVNVLGSGGADAAAIYALVASSHHTSGTFGLARSHVVLPPGINSVGQ